MRVSRRSVRSGLLLGLLVVGGAHAAEPLRPRLSGLWDRWLADEGLLLTERERSYFDSLETEEMRELFAAAFWRSRGDAVLERWSSNREAAERTRPRSPAGRRAVLLFGKPASIERIEACGGLRPLEIWRWDPWLIERQGGSADETLRLVLVQQNRLLPASFAPWDPSDPEALGYYPTAARDLDAYLDQIRPASCVSADLRGRLAEAAPLDRLREAMPWPRPEASWLDELATLGGDLAPAPGIVFDVDYHGTNGRQTIVR